MKEPYEAYQARMTKAFNKVCDQENWKMPVDAVVELTGPEVEEMREAIIHFTGSVPAFAMLADGRCRVTAVGYYTAIGA